MKVSAPGKIVLLGDYAVLDGGVAMVGAVNRRATGEVVTENVDASSVVRAVLEHGKRDVPGSIRIDTSSFHTAAGDKLGLGSSAAVAVVASTLVLDTGDESVLSLAIEAHRAAAGGEGSGADVAAAYHGGVVAARRQPSPVEPLPSRIPGLTMSVLFAGKSAKTKDLVAAARKCSRWSHWMTVLKPLAERGIDAWCRGQTQLFTSIVDRYGRAMGGLGKDAGVSIVTDEIDAVIKLAAEGGGAAKPSGAGGGDVVVMWAADESLAPSIAERTGLQLLDLEIDPAGMYRRQ